MKKLKAGAILLSAEWFSDISYDTTIDASANISQIVNHAVKDTVAVLEKHFEVVHPYPIATKADVQAALHDFKSAQVDLFVICSLIYSGDDTVIDILREISCTHHIRSTVIHIQSVNTRNTKLSH